MSEGLSRESKRSSFLAFRRSLSPNDHDPKGKGKAKAFRKSWQGPHDEASDMTRISSKMQCYNGAIFQADVVSENRFEELDKFGRQQQQDHRTAQQAKL